MDDRNDDSSEATIASILSSGSASNSEVFHIEKNRFIGFGQARTLSLEMAWKYFPHASHVMIADPDWRPVVETMKLQDLIQANAEVYRFTVYDRNGVTTRQIDWLLRHRPNLSMRYHLHEVLNIGYYSWTNVPWQVREIEQAGTWHTKVGHSDSFDAKRYLFDLSMLKADKEMYPNDPHCDYYLGITHSAYAEKLRMQPLAARLGLEVGANISSDAPGGLTAADMEARESLKSTLDYHYQQAIKSLLTRITSKYEHEFIEQRWGSMLTLSHMYDDAMWVSTYDSVSANTWYQLCRDFNKNTFECSSFLVQQYLRIGVLKEAIFEANVLIRTEFKQRSMLNTIRDLQCVMPTIVNNAFLMHVVALQSGENMQKKGISAYAKYTLLLSLWVSGNEQCTEAQRHKALLSPEAAIAIDASIQADGKCLHVKNAGTGTDFDTCTSLLTQTTSVEVLCQDPDVLSYLTQDLGGVILVHPCGAELQAQAKNKKTCDTCMRSFPSLGEEFQTSAFGEYIGAASIIDIVHQMHQGNGVRVMLNEPTMIFRVLFAEYFNLKMVMNLISYSTARMNGQIDITLVSSDAAKLKEFKDTWQLCTPNNTIKVHVYQYNSLATWLSEYRAALELQATTKNKSTGSDSRSTVTLPLFDYIEYNGGPSLSHHLQEELAGFQNVLASDGVLGITYFTQNIHVQNIVHMHQDANVPNIDTDFRAHVFPDNGYAADGNINSAYPSSMYRLVKSYLDYHNMNNLAQDEQLVVFLAQLAASTAVKTANDGDGNAEKARPGNSLLNSKAFTQTEIKDLLRSANFSTGSWLPTAYSNPYTELSNYPIKKFWAAGMSQELFLKMFVPSFRQIVYVQKAHATSTAAGKEQSVADTVRPAGRAKVSSLLGNSQVGDGFIIVDRLGNLGRTFARGAELAKSRNSLQFSTGHYSLSKHYNISYVVPPSTLPSLEHLSNSPTFSQLLSANVEFWAQDAEEQRSSSDDADAETVVLYSFEQVRGDLISFLEFLESLDMVSCLHNLITEESPAMQNVRFSRQAKYGAVDAKSVYNAAEGSQLTHSQKVKQMIAENLKKKELAENKAQDVRVTKAVEPFPRRPRLNKQQLFESHRRPACALDDVSWREANCLDPIDHKIRPSAQVALACYAKIEYDIRQFQYIALKKPQVGKQITKDVIPSLQRILQTLKSRVDSSESKLDIDEHCTMLTADDMKSINGYHNRVFLYSREPKPSWGQNMFNAEAASYVANAMNAIQISLHDFVVVNVALKKPALQALSNILLTSFVWFDSTNSRTFVAHHDDGLAHDAFFQLAQEISKLASHSIPKKKESENFEKFNVVKYFAIAMDTYHPVGNSPIIMTPAGQIAALLWIGPTTPNVIDEEEVHTDGIVVYDYEIKDALYAASPHTSGLNNDFFMLGDQFAGMSAANDAAHGSVINRKSNRLVLFKQEVPFLLSIRKDPARTEGNGRKTFDQSTMLAFVVILEKEGE